MKRRPLLEDSPSRDAESSLQAWLSSLTRLTCPTECHAGRPDLLMPDAGGITRKPIEPVHPPGDVIPQHRPEIDSSDHATSLESRLSPLSSRSINASAPIAYPVRPSSRIA